MDLRIVQAWGGTGKCPESPGEAAGRGAPCTDPPAIGIAVLTDGWGVPRILDSRLILSHQAAVQDPWYTPTIPESCLEPVSAEGPVVRFGG